MKTKTEIHSCLKCGKRHRPGEEACEVPPHCVKCIAKNFCKNKDPTDPTMLAEVARIKYSGELWEKRRCK